MTIHYRCEEKSLKPYHEKIFFHNTRITYFDQYYLLFLILHIYLKIHVLHQEWAQSKNASVDISNFYFEAHFAEATPGARAVGQMWIVSVSSDLDLVVPILNLSIYHLFTFY